MSEKKEISKETKQKLLSAVLQKPYKFEVIDNKTGETKKFTINPPCLNCLLEISLLLSNVDLNEIFDEKANTFALVKKYGVILAKSATLILCNSDKLDEEVYNYLLNNLDARELHEVFTEAILRTGISDFRKSIIESQSMSLMNDREKIALTMKKTEKTPESSTLGN